MGLFSKTPGHMTQLGGVVMGWVSTLEDLPKDQQRVLFIAAEFGVSPFVFVGYYFANNWFIDSTFYGLEHPDSMAPAEVYYWLAIPPVPEEKRNRYLVRMMKLEEL